MRYATLESVRMVIGGDAVLDAGIDLVRRADTSLSAEFFKLQDGPARSALQDAWNGRGLPGSVVISAHPQIIRQVDGIAGPAVSVTHYGGLVPVEAPREFIHTKTLARDLHTDHPEAWLATAAFGGRAREEWEVAGMFGGDAARAVHELADSVASRDWQRQRDALAWARTQGIYATDPVTNDTSLGAVIHELVRTEPTGLTVAMKTFFDERFAGELARRSTRDRLPVTVIADRIDEPSERALREGGVRLARPADDVPQMHANVIVGDGLDQAYFGTLWASPRGFGRDHVPHLYTGGGDPLPRSEQWDRSRELGVITSDSQAVRDLRDGFSLLRAAPNDFRPDVVRPR